MLLCFLDILFYVYWVFCLHVYNIYSPCPQRPEEGVRSSRTGIIVLRLHKGVGTWTRVLCKNNRCSEPLSPYFCCFKPPYLWYITMTSLTYMTLFPTSCYWKNFTLPPGLLCHGLSSFKGHIWECHSGNCQRLCWITLGIHPVNTSYQEITA